MMEIVAQVLFWGIVSTAWVIGYHYLAENFSDSQWRYEVWAKVLHISRFLVVIAVIPLWIVAIGMLIHTIGLRGAGVLVALFLIFVPVMWIVFHVTAPLVWLLWHETKIDKRKKGS